MAAEEEELFTRLLFPFLEAADKRRKQVGAAVRMKRKKIKTRPVRMKTSSLLSRVEFTSLSRRMESVILLFYALDILLIWGVEGWDKLRDF